MRTLKVAMLAAVIAFSFTLQPAMAQDMAHQTRLDGKTATAVIAAYGELLRNSGLRTDQWLSDISQVSVSRNGDAFTVKFVSKQSTNTRAYLVQDGRAKKTRMRPDHQMPLTMLPANAVHSINAAYSVWRESDMGKRYGLLASTVLIDTPYPHFRHIVWVAFAPPEPKLPKFTLGCGVERGFSVNTQTHVVTALKQVC